jgi:hypothetical protein
LITMFGLPDSEIEAESQKRRGRYRDRNRLCQSAKVDSDCDCDPDTDPDTDDRCPEGAYLFIRRVRPRAWATFSNIATDFHPVRDFAGDMHTLRGVLTRDLAGCIVRCLGNLLAFGRAWRQRTRAISLELQWILVDHLGAVPECQA